MCEILPKMVVYIVYVTSVHFTEAYNMPIKNMKNDLQWYLFSANGNTISEITVIFVLVIMN